MIQGAPVCVPGRRCQAQDPAPADPLVRVRRCRTECSGASLPSGKSSGGRRLPEKVSSGEDQYGRELIDGKSSVTQFEVSDENKVFKPSK